MFAGGPLSETPVEKVAKYEADLRFFMQLRSSVRRRYAEVVDFKEYELRIQKLIDQHVGTGEMERITELVNIFDADAFAKEVEKLDSAASKADTIAYRTKHTIHDRMQEDPAFYRRFSELLEEAIRAFREQRLSDAEYLRKVSEVAKRVRNRTGDDIPAALAHRDVAKAFFGERKRLSITVYPDGSVTALAPADRPLEQVLAHLTRRRSWIAKQRRHFETYHPLPERKRFVSGETHLDQPFSYSLAMDGLCRALCNRSRAGSHLTLRGADFGDGSAH